MMPSGQGYFDSELSTTSGVPVPSIKYYVREGLLPRGELVSPDIVFLVMRDRGEPVGMGALKRLSGDHAEIKSMHVMAERRGEGLSRRMLEALVAQARAGGFARLSLETGAQNSFRAARGLYAGAGFVECGPFKGSGPDPNSLFMTRIL